MRVLLFTGKGGVGKTTTAAATAYQTALQGYKTLVISTDPAHSLSDALDVNLGPEPTEIMPNLFGQELNVYYSMKKYWGNIRELLLAVFKLQGFNNLVAEELSALPGMEEASAFLWIEKYYEEKAFDVIVIDSAPTGETLTLLTIPQVAQFWTSKAFPFQKTAIKMMGATMRTFTGIPLDTGYEELDNLYTKLQKVQEIFSNPEICTIRVVMNPERMVINEAKRAYAYLQMYGYIVDAILVNRILPDKKNEGDFFAKYKEKQKKYLTEIEDSFAPLPLFKIPHLGEEVFGLDLLKKIAEELYPKQDPTEIFYKESPLQIIPDGNSYKIRLRIPFLEGDADVQHLGNQIVINIGGRRRNLFLPQFMNFFQLRKFSYKDEWLEMSFGK